MKLDRSGSREAGVTERVKLQVANYGTWWLFFFFFLLSHIHKPKQVLLSWSAHVKGCENATSPRGSGPHTLVRRGVASGCCRSAGGPGSRCRSWCCRGTRKSRESTLRFCVEKSRFKMVVKSVKILHLTVDHSIVCAAAVLWWSLGEFSPQQAVTVPCFWRLSHGIFLDLRV